MAKDKNTKMLISGSVDAKKILMKLDPKVLEQIMSMQQQHDR